MKLKYSIIAFVFIGLSGTLGHFLYEFTNNNLIVGYFFPINESTWEHLKLIFFPTMIFSLIEYNFVKNEIANYAPSVIISVITGMISIVLIFYGYNGVLGYNIDWINIAIYYISLIIMLIIKNSIIDKEIFKSRTASVISLAIGFTIALLFVIFTYNPPTLGIFKKP